MAKANAIEPLSDIEQYAKVEETVKLPVLEIPGDYGWPFIGPIKDRLDYFYNQGEDEFFRSRMSKYKSTVFRSNMPPGPFISSDSKVIVLLDGRSFPVLFDVSKVEKKDVFTGTYMPSTQLTGGYRVLSYLDPSESKHAKLKQLLFFLLKSRQDYIIPEFEKTYTEMFKLLEDGMSSKGKVSINSLNDQAAFNFLGRALYETYPPETKLGTNGPKLITIWLGVQLSPIVTLGLPRIIEDPLLHTFPLLPCLVAFVKSKYGKLFDFFKQYSGSILDEAEKMGLSRDEACHNLVFATCFNTFGGMKVIIPSLFKWIGKAGIKLQSELVKEIRAIIRSSNGNVTLSATEQMPLMKSVVYETLRIQPPVPYQYGRAKNDLMIESHDASFKVKKGEMLFGFQPFATKDPKIFERPDEFVPDRFVGVEGKKLLQYVVWSNGPETESPTINNKQCAGKDFVIMVCRLLVVELFLRYDSFEIEFTSSGLNDTVTITSLKKATSLSS